MKLSVGEGHLLNLLKSIYLILLLKHVNLLHVHGYLNMTIKPCKSNKKKLIHQTLQNG